MSMSKLADDALEQGSGGTILRYLVQQGDTVQKRSKPRSGDRLGIVFDLSV